MIQYHCMNKSTPYARIAITLPAADLEAADQLAREWDRSRSWVIAEAVRQLVRAQSARASSPGLGDSRLQQLRRDLSLSPEQRVLAAEQTLRNVPRAQTAPPGPRMFERYEDFLDWKNHRGRA
jgi:hypothetical protein